MNLVNNVRMGNMASRGPLASSIDGCPVELNDTFRLGMVVIEFASGHFPTLRMSSATLSSLVQEVQAGGVMPLASALSKEIEGAKVVMQTRMVDLGQKTGKKVVDRRNVKRYSDDRVDQVCRGISDLTSQMATLLALASPGEGQVSHAAKRYAELAGEMKKLRAAMMAAEGHFEIAQQQVIKLMGGDDE